MPNISTVVTCAEYKYTDKAETRGEHQIVRSRSKPHQWVQHFYAWWNRVSLIHSSPTLRRNTVGRYKWSRVLFRTMVLVPYNRLKQLCILTSMLAFSKMSCYHMTVNICHSDEYSSSRIMIIRTVICSQVSYILKISNFQQTMFLIKITVIYLSLLLICSQLYVMDWKFSKNLETWLEFHVRSDTNIKCIWKFFRNYDLISYLQKYRLFGCLLDMQMFYIYANLN